MILNGEQSMQLIGLKILMELQMLWRLNMLNVCRKSPLQTIRPDIPQCFLMATVNHVIPLLP